MIAAVLLATTVTAAAGGAATGAATTRATPCPGWGRPAIAADPRPGALRVFAIQFAQRPAAMVTAADYRRAIACAMTTEVVPHLARGRPDLVVFDGGYAPALRYVESRFPALSGQLGRSFVAATDTFVRVFMTTMAQVARRYRVYVIASNTQAPFALTRDRAAVAALAGPGSGGETAVYAPTAGAAYDQTFLWGPRVVRRHAPAPLANLLADNRKVPLTAFEQELGFATGPTGGAAARRNLRPVAIPGTGARLGIATSLPAFRYGPAGGDPCADVTVTYMRCLNRLGANVVIQADANDGPWTGTDGAERWQPLSWMGSAWRAVSDPSVGFTYAVNPFMVGNLADTPFDGQSAILQRGRRGPGCHYVGNGGVVAGDDIPADRGYAGAKPQFLAIAPWVAPDGPRSRLRRRDAALARTGGYVQTALVADLPFPADRSRRGCVEAGR